MHALLVVLAPALLIAAALGMHQIEVRMTREPHTHPETETVLDRGRPSEAAGGGAAPVPRPVDRRPRQA